MKHIWKRSLSMFLALVMVIGMLPMNAFAAETEEQVAEETFVTEPVETTLPVDVTEPSAEPEELPVVTETNVQQETVTAEVLETTEETVTPAETETVPVEIVVEEELPQKAAPVAMEFTEEDFVSALRSCQMNNEEEFVLQYNLTITGEVEIPEDVRVRIDENGSIHVAEDAILYVEGILCLDAGCIKVDGMLINNTDGMAKGFLVDVGCSNAQLIIGETGQFINVGYFRMSAGELVVEAGGEFTYDYGDCYLSSDVVLSGNVEEMIGKENIALDFFADSENDILEGMNLRAGYKSQNVIVIGFVRAASLMDLPDSAAFNLQVGYSNTRSDAELPGSLIIGDGARLTVNNAMFVMNNGFVQVEAGGLLVNNGRIDNRGVILTEQNLENNGTIEGNPVGNQRDAQSDFEDMLADCAGNDFVLTEPITLIRDLTIDLQGGTFYVADGGSITVPQNTTLYVESQMQVAGGKIVVLENGGLTCVNGGHIRVNANGLVYFETGAFYNVSMDGPAYWEENGDTASQLLFYNVADEGSGVSPQWGNYRSGGIHFMPGQAITGLFCFRVWDNVNYEWDEIFMDPQDITCGAGLTMTRLKDMPNPGHIITGDTFANKYVTIQADNTFVDTDIRYSYGQEDFLFNVRIGRPMEHGFYTADYASDETFLNHFNDCYTMDPQKGENSFYYIFTAGGDWKVETFKVVDNPFDLNPVEEVTWEKISDTVYKIIIKPEAMEQAGGFPVHVEVEVSHPNNSRWSRWGIGQLWCMSPDQGQNALEAELQYALENGESCDLWEQVVLNRDLTIDLAQNVFHINRGGMLVVPNGVTLTVNSLVEVDNGKIVVLDGGRLECVNGHIEILGKGLVYFEDGSFSNIWSMNGPAYWERNGDTDPQLLMYDVADTGSGLAPNRGHFRFGNISVMPGGFTTGLICFREWDASKYEWNEIFMDPQDLEFGEGLTMTRLQDMPEPGHILTGDKYARKYITIQAENEFDVDSYISYSYGGEEYRIDVRIERPSQHGFYTEANASNETFLNHFTDHFAVDPLQEENAFYYIFTAEGDWKVETFQVVDNPFDRNPVEEVEWEKITDTVYKIIIKQEAIQSAGRFPVHVDVEVSHPNNTDWSRWGIGQLWCEIPDQGQDTLEEQLQEAKDDGKSYTLRERVVLSRDLTIDLGKKNFCIAEGGMIIVPNGVTLQFESPAQIEGGKIIVLNGGKLKTPGPSTGYCLQINAGFVFLETGANYDFSYRGTVFKEAEGDTEAQLVFYNIMDEGSGIVPSWNNFRAGSTSLIPCWSMTGLFSFRVWDSVNYEWNEIFMNPAELECGEGLTMTPLKDMPDHGHIMTGDRYGNKYVTITADNVFDVNSGISYKYGGEEFRFNIRIGRPYEHGFYTTDEATNETFINHLNTAFEVDPAAAENAFYYIFTANDGWKVENITVVDNPFDRTPVKEVAVTKITDTVYKITIKPEVVAAMDYTNDFPIHVEAEVSNADNGHINRWGIGQLWCDLPMMPQDALEEKLDECVTNGMDWDQHLKTVLQEDLTIDLGEQLFTLHNPGVLVVPAGKTLTVNSDLVLDGGKILIQGGQLVINGEVTVRKGSIVLEDGGSVVNNGTLNNQDTIVLGDGTVTGSGILHTSLQGIDNVEQVSCEVIYTADITSETALLDAVSGGLTKVYVNQDITLKKALTIPYDVTLVIAEGATLKVNTKTTFANNGNIVVYGTLDITSTTLVGNYGQIEVYGEMKLATGSSQFYVNNGKTLVYSEGSFVMTSGRIGADRICRVPDSEENLGYLELPSMYRNYHYVKGMPLYSIQAWAIGYEGMDSISVPVGTEIRMCAGGAYPTYAEHSVRYTVSASNSPEKDPLKVITSEEPGLVTVTIHMLDDEGNETGVTDTLDVEFFAQEIHVTDSAGNEINADEAVKLLSGEKISLVADIAGNATGANVVWELAKGADFAALSVKSGVATVAAKTLTGAQDVVLVARAEDNTARKEITLRIIPKVQILKLQDAEGNDVTGKTLTFDLKREAEKTMVLQTNAAPADAWNTVTWSDGNGIVETITDLGDGQYELRFTGEPGKVTLTATATDGSKKTAKVTVNAVELLQTVVAEKSEDKLIGGQSVTYSVVDENGNPVKNSLVEWFLCDNAGNERNTAHPYASITAKGKLTTKVVAAPEQVFIRARVIGNESQMTGVVTIDLYPALTQIKVLVNNEPVAGTLYYDYAAPADLQLSVEGYPCNDAIDHAGIRWSRPSKSESIADIDAESGMITPKGNGTVTFTGKVPMWNGTTKNVTVKVTFGTAVKDIVLYTWDNDGGEIEQENFGFWGGRSFEPLRRIETRDANGNVIDENAEVIWTVEPGYEDYLTIENGKFIVEEVNNPVWFTVTATSMDGRASVTREVYIDGPENSLLLKNTDTNEYVTKETLVGATGTKFYLAVENAENHPEEPWISNDENVATVDENGVVTIVGEGPATITAKDADGRTATVKVKGTRVSEGVKITSENGFTVASGKTLTLVGTVTYSDNKTNTSVNWSVSDASLAKISSKGVLTASANLTETKTVTVTAEAKDGLSSGSVEVTILPLATGVAVLDDSGENVTNTTVTMVVNATMDLDAQVFPAAATDKVTWSTNSTKVVKIDKETGELTCMKAGTATITATAADGSGKKATFKITVVKPMDSETLEPLAEQIWGIGGGKKLNLVSAIKIPKDVTNKKLVWELDGEGAAYASISSSGVLTTKAVTSSKLLKVRATAADGFGAKSDWFEVTIYPVITAVSIVNDDGVTVNNKTLNIFVGDTLNLNALAKPGNAWEAFDWTSSKNSYATVEDGVVTGLEAGAGKTVTITALAKDGSGKKATVKVKILRPVESIDFQDNLFIAGGKTLKLAGKVTFNADSGTKPTVQTLKWTILEGGEYATINTKGELKAKKVQVQKTIHVQAVSTDGTDVVQDCYVTVYPAASKVLILDASGKNVSGKTITLKKGEAEVFDVKINPANGLQQWTWTSSDTKGTYVRLDAETGVVEVIKGGKTVTLTATAADGSGTKATVKIKTK